MTFSVANLVSIQPLDYSVTEYQIILYPEYPGFDCLVIKVVSTFYLFTVYHEYSLRPLL